MSSDSEAPVGIIERRFPTIARHLSILRESWGDQNDRDKAFRPKSDHEFLPAALEIMEKPPSPGLRWLLIILCSLFAIALIWAFVGRIDVVATAQGQVVPSTNSRIIQPIEIGAVRALHVRNGQRVKKGQLLVELDPTITEATQSQSAQQLLSAEVVDARNAALLSYLNGGSGTFAPPPGTSPDLVATQSSFVRSAIAAFVAERAALFQQREQRRAELAGAQAEIVKLRQTLPLLDKQLAARQELADKGYFSKLKLLEYQQLRVEHIQNIEVQEANAQQSRAAVANISAQLQQLEQSFARGAASEQAEAQDRSAVASEELRKDQRRRQFQQIRSPVDGTVQQLAITTIGAVVQPAEPIMVIVPDDAEVAVTARILNKDIGFIHVGQPVRVKLEAFNFTDYGFIDGVVEDISRDAVQDEQMGLIFIARIHLNRRFLMVAGERTPIGPGLAVQAEIKTGERHIIQYLLSPIAQSLDEAGRER
ncbi:HlyD family type I secretion periplasmic adaptor subunit [Novosphingopyxis sp.]|uniref:HlyD family type I secretion periplasmic adaptor subunit n=1 Tax=Novosphingopyxis sp. TaxID=2709690 RepID=UPI003B5BD743